jgi:hypothetical protein
MNTFLSLLDILCYPSHPLCLPFYIPTSACLKTNKKRLLQLRARRCSHPPCMSLPPPIRLTAAPKQVTSFHTTIKPASNSATWAVLAKLTCVFKGERDSPGIRLWKRSKEIQKKHQKLREQKKEDEEKLLQRVPVAPPAHFDAIKYQQQLLERARRIDTARKRQQEQAQLQAQGLQSVLAYIQSCNV